MKNTAGVTSVEYEIRMTDSKSVNVFRKTLSPAEAFNPDLVSAGNFNTFSSDYEVGPGHVTVTLIVTLTLLLTMLAAVAILYRTIQKRMTSFPEGDTSSPEVQTPLPRNKMPFLQNNMTLTHEQQQQLQAQLTGNVGNYVTVPSELALLRTSAVQTLDRSRFQSNKLKNSSSDSAFNVLTTFNATTDIPLEAAYQYLTVARRHPPPTVSGPPPPVVSNVDTSQSYSIIQKKTSRQPLKTSNEARDRSIPRYCTPNLTNLEDLSGVGCSSPKRVAPQPPSDLHHSMDCHHHCLPQEWNQEEESLNNCHHQQQHLSSDQDMIMSQEYNNEVNEGNNKHPTLLSFCDQMMNERL